MNIRSKLPTTQDEFLRWNEGREGKREFVRGSDSIVVLDLLGVELRLSDLYDGVDVRLGT